MTDFPLAGSKRKNARVKPADVKGRATSCECGHCNDCVFAEISDVVALVLKDFIGRPVTQMLRATLAVQTGQALSRRFNVPIPGTALVFSETDPGEFSINVDQVKTIIDASSKRERYATVMTMTCTYCGYVSPRTVTVQGKHERPERYLLCGGESCLTDGSRTRHITT